MLEVGNYDSAMIRMLSSTVNRDCHMKVFPAFEALDYNSLILGEHLTEASS